MDNKMAEPRKNDFESREYQTELFEMALEKNLILYLPTGSGKTYIATLLLKEIGKRNEILLHTSILNGGKRIFFLVNTVALVEQQALQIQSQSNYCVGRFSGDMGVDLWDISNWITELNDKQVLVMTCQIFVDLTLNHTIGIKNAALIIFDECHRAVANHPMRQVMKNFDGVPIKDQPRVLGLTATLLNGNIKPSDLSNQIRTLENTFMAQIATSTNEEMVKMYSTNPKESKVTYCKNETSSRCYNERDKILGMFKIFVEKVEFEDAVKPQVKPENARQIDTNWLKTNKRLKNVASDIEVNMNDLGLYGGSLSFLAHLVQMQQMVPNVLLETSRLAYQSVTADCVLLRKKLENEIRSWGVSDQEAIRRFSSDKVIKLLDILKKLTTTDSAIIFVKMRFTAKVLYYLVKKVSAIDPRLSHIKCNFIVGYNVGNPFKDTRENYLQRAQNKKVMKQFNAGELNVIFASNVVEEGVDITQCNFVIMFDPPQDFRSYVQSKGRARDKDSKYIIMICQSDITFHSKYEGFCAVERLLKEILYGGKSKLRLTPTLEEIKESLFEEKPGLEPYKPYGKDGPVVTAISAISLINRYFASLRPDKFTKNIPFWWLKEAESKCKCFLQLPMESKDRSIIEGTWQPNKEDAKRSVALEACKKLHQCGELGDLNLLPLGLENLKLKLKAFTPNVRDDVEFEMDVNGKKIKIGTNKNKRSCEKKWADCLSNCRPEPNKTMYLHVLNVTPMHSPLPENNRLIVLHQELSQTNQYGILSSTKIPKLAPFPLYMSTGELEASVMDAHEIILNKNQLTSILEFHCMIFDNVLAVAKKFMLRDNSNQHNAYLVVPVILDPFHGLNIDWGIITETRTPFPSSDVKPSREERMKITITDENYLGKIISPWYRNVPSQKYLVTKVCYDMSEHTTFPTDIYSTYKEYFQDKYKIEPLIKNQPLLEVRAISGKLNSIKPRALSRQLRRKNKEENEDFEVWLLPEFCLVYPLPGRYWLKALLLPSILHRVSRLCLAEELRCSISRSTGIGSLLPDDFQWKKLTEDNSLLQMEAISKSQQDLSSLPILSKSFNRTKDKFAVWEEEEPVDIERSMESVSIFDVMAYGTFINKPLLGLKSETGVNGVSPHKLTGNKKNPIMCMVEPPPLHMLQKNSKALGPEQVEVLQAITSAVANDFINCERLETLGDSFLKFAISLVLFETQTDLREGHLTYLKGSIVGNKNLFFCGRQKNLGPMLEVHDFLPGEEWVPPGFCVDHSAQGVLRRAQLDPSCLYKLDIPHEERVSGRLGDATHMLLSEILMNAEESVQPQNYPFINQQALTDKNVSDSVEAILGVYLKSCGIQGAIAVLNWLKVTDPTLSLPDVFTERRSSPAKSMGNPNIHLHQPEELEKILNYKFQDRFYLLQALTHPSYTRNSLTLCYQRLEFLGDAIIDFLITIHIYEKCTSLSPGDLTDLRSALVNNITLACISVRNNLHKFLLFRSSTLNDCTMRFVRHQEDKDHIIDNDVLFLMEENDVNIAEAVDVPKSLGDIFEALIGAIYLDSGKNLDVTWKIVYNLMSKEIEQFHKDVPKNHVRMLYESSCSPSFHSTVVDLTGAVMVTVEICHNGTTMNFNGFGDNKHQAKRAAAKHALRAIRSSSKE